MRGFCLFALLVGCGGSKSAQVPTPSGPPASFTAAAAKDDVQVATVNDRPVWGSCVTAQAARGATREQALQECIDFELLAQAAEMRDLALDHEVVLATRAALVSQLIAKDYEDAYTRPEQFGTYWTRSIERNKPRFDHPEGRTSAYVRVEVDKNAPPGVDAQAKQTIEAIYAALANERGLMKPQLEEIATRAAGTTKIKVAAVPPDLGQGRLDPTYTRALFAIPEVGRVSRPVRTPWGWDIVLWDAVIPAVHATPEEVVALAMPEIKRSYFPQWVNLIGKSLGVKVEVFDKNLPLLENL